MTKAKFLETLEAKLGALPKSEVEKSLVFYSEIIDDKIEDGMSESKAIGSLGSVEEVVEKILQDTSLATLIKSRIHHKRNIASTILLIVGAPLWLPLLLVFVLVLLSLYISLWAIVASLFVAATTMLFGGICGLINCWFYLGDIATAGMILGTGFVLLALSVLVFLSAVLCTKLLIKLAVLVLRKIKNIFIRKETKNV